MPQSERRAAALLLLGWLATGALLARLAWLPGLNPLQPWTALQHQPPVRTLPLLLAAAVLVLGLWLALTVLLTALSRLPGLAGRAALTTLRHLSPAILRRAAEVTLGATTVLTVASGTAQAVGRPAISLAMQQTAPQREAAPPLDRSAHATSSPATPAQIVFNLDRPATPPEPALPAPPSLDRPASDPSRGLALVSPPGPRTLAHQAQAVRVKVGDSLWRIAARSLPPGASDGEIERTWHRWYAANRAVIGDDPDLLLPGQLLMPPRT